MNLSKNEIARPSFLPKYWPEYTGWKLPHILPYPLDDKARLDTENPWDKFLFVLVKAMKGDFQYSEILIDLIQFDLEHFKPSGLEILAGSILSTAQLKELFPLIGTNKSFLMYEIAQASCWIDFLEPMFNNRFDTELKPEFFSHFLEPRYLDWSKTLEEKRPYFDHVKKRVNNLKFQHSHIKYFLRGKPLHIETILDELIEDVEDIEEEDEYSFESVNDLLWRIETIAGIKGQQIIFPTADYCIKWNKVKMSSALQGVQFEQIGKLKFDRLALEKNLEIIKQTDFSSYKPGHRYFFSHFVD